MKGNDPPPRLAISMPNIRQASAVPDSNSPSASNGVFVGSRISSMKNVTSTMPSTPIGTLMKKIHRQDR